MKAIPVKVANRDTEKGEGGIVYPNSMAPQTQGVKNTLAAAGSNVLDDYDIYRNLEVET